MIILEKIESLSEFIDKIEQIQNSFLSDKKTDEHHINFFYRGQCNVFKPLPSAFRKGFMDKEDYLYHELILRCPEFFRGLSHLDTLVMMQHYGLPTRLLDVTSNPLVALYFACKDYTSKYNDSGYVYIYGAEDKYTVYADSDRVLILSCLPIFSLKQKKSMLNDIKDEFDEPKIKVTTKNKYPASIERLYHEITKEMAAFQREIKPYDLVTPLFVKPLRVNGRILKQDGAFIISGLCDNKDEAENKIENLCSQVIEIDNRQTILQQLDAVGINEANLFPEVDKVADYLKEKCKVRNENRNIYST